MSYDSSEEVDYMSDSFLQTICGKEDIRPGLIKCHAQQHDHKAAVKRMVANEKNRSRNPSLLERQTTSRENGLSVPINKENVGFKMLQKLGFTPGSGLGKSGEGRVDPIFLEVKTDRQGLGRKSSLEEIARLRAKYKSEAKEKALNIDDYRTRKAGEAAEKKAFSDLMKSQRVCWELDSKEFINEPAEIWFWPESKLTVNKKEDESSTSDEEEDDNKEADGDEDEDQEKDIDFSVQEKLEMLTLYLRKTYFYCVWCGYTFEDEKDLQQDCPGPTKEDH